MVDLDDCLQQLVHRLLRGVVDGTTPSSCPPAKEDEQDNETATTAGAIATNRAAASLPKRRPYLVLLQHSQSLALRRDQHQQGDFHSSDIGRGNAARSSHDGRNDADEAAIYRRAGLLTPSEAAALDWQAGAAALEHMAETVLLNNTRSSSSDNTTTTTDNRAASVIWIQTLPHRRNRIQSRDDGTVAATGSPIWLHHLQEKYGSDRVQIVDCCGGGRVGRGPFGWQASHSDVTDSRSQQKQQTAGTNLEDLKSIVTAIRGAIETTSIRQGPVVLMIESIAPIVVRHGMTKALRVVQHIKEEFAATMIPFIVLPVVQEALSHQQDVCLENGSADAIVRFHGGVCDILRHSVRQGRNAPLAREKSMAYTLQMETTETSGTATANTKLIQHRRLQFRPSPVGDRTSGTEDDTGSTAVASTGVVPLESSKARHAGPALAIHEGARDSVPALAVAPSQQPNIYMQDDDPEFDDFDEEDPDDDLDL